MRVLIESAVHFRENVGLFLGNVGLFLGNMGHFLGNVGLFFGKTATLNRCKGEYLMRCGRA